VSEPYVIELFRFVLGLFTAMSVLAVTWLVGLRLATYWTLRQKRNELNFAALQAFHATYGQFKELVKTWRLIKKADDVPPPVPSEERWALLKRACALESKMEALALRVATERKLTDEQLLTLGLLRQGMQTVRESIREDKANPLGSRGVEYQLVNELASAVASLVSDELPARSPSPAEARAQLARIAEVRKARWKEVVSNAARAEPEDEDEDA
jgi:hypothetical protein